MARIKVAKQADLDDTNNTLSQLNTVVTDPATGTNKRISNAELTIDDISSTIGADDTSGLRKRVTDNEGAIGDANSGLTKQVADLESTVGTDNTQGLQLRVGSLEDSVNGANDDPSLQEQITASETAISELISKPVAAWDADEDTAENSNISVAGDDVAYFLGGMAADTTANTVTVPLSGLYRVTLNSIVYMSGLTENQTQSVEVRVNNARVHTFRVYADIALSYMTIGGSITIPINADDTVAFQTRGSTVLYGSNGDYTNCAIEYIRPLTD